MKNLVVSSLIAALVLALLPATARAQDANAELPPAPARISAVETEHQAVTWLARTYRNERIIGSASSLVLGIGLTTIGMLEMMDATNIYDGRDDQVIGAFFVGTGAGAIGIGTVGLIGPFSDAEVYAHELATSESPDTEEMRRFLQRCADVAQRERWIGSIATIATGAGFLIAGALYEQEDDSLSSLEQEVSSNNNTQTVFFVVGGVMVATGLSVAFVASPEERFAEQFGLGDDASLDGGRMTMRIAPLVTRIDDRNYGGLSLTVR